MGRAMGSVGSVACLLFIGTLLPVIVAVDHEVGGDFGWNLPPTRTFFSEWARNTTFFVGDRLSNNYQYLFLFLRFFIFYFC